MGIATGGQMVRSYFRRGLYKRNFKENCRNTGGDDGYFIYVDGELIRHKGMIAQNLVQTHPEEAIAHTSFKYLNNLVSSVERHLKRSPKQVIVYLDGKRVRNKITNRPEFSYDSGLIRNVFKLLCVEVGFVIKELEYGESELMMYLERDRNSELNVFVTADTDMLSILYDHRPTLAIIGKNGEETNSSLSSTSATRRRLPCGFFGECETTTRRRRFNDDASRRNGDDDNVCDHRNRSSDFFVEISDENYDYEEDAVRKYVIEEGEGSNCRIVDSCLWICGQINGHIAVGMDFSSDRLSYNANVFRAFAALNGTDFTVAMCTPTMMHGFFEADSEDVECINSLTDWNEIAAACLFLGVKSGGTLKLLKNQDQPPFRHREVDVMLKIYDSYVSTGRMSERETTRPNMSLASRHYLFALFGGVTSNFVKKSVIQLASGIKLYEAIENFRRCFDTYTHVKKNTTRKTTTTTTKKVFRNEIDVVPFSSRHTSSTSLSLNDETAPSRQKVARNIARLSPTTKRLSDGDTEEQRERDYLTKNDKKRVASTTSAKKTDFKRVRTITNDLLFSSDEDTDDDNVDNRVRPISSITLALSNARETKIKEYLREVCEKHKKDDDDDRDKGWISCSFKPTTSTTAKLSNTAQIDDDEKSRKEAEEAYELDDY